MRGLAVVLLATLALGAEPAMTFVKSFPGSRPAYVEITVRKDGAYTYKEAADDDEPLQAKLSAEDAAAMFALAEKLGRFKRPLESGLNVARMGQKTFRWTDGAVKQQTEFNYTQDLDGQALHDWFERISESSLHLFDLERAARFDRIGVYKVLLQLEASWDRKRLVAVDQYLKLLDRIAQNDTYLNMARERAAKLAAVFRNPPKAQPQ